jgi:hypothetical protein
MEEKDRRRAARFEAEGEVTLAFMRGDETCQGHLKDISKNGIFIKLDYQPKESWQNLGCKFHLTSTIEGKAYNITGQAHITRITPVGMGLFLTTINTGSRRVFVQLMIHVMNSLHKLS